MNPADLVMTSFKPPRYTPNGLLAMRGITTVSMAIALTVAGMLTLASARYAIQKFDEDRGTLVGNQLQAVTDALAAYIRQNTDVLSDPSFRDTDKISIKANALPTVAQLKAQKFLHTSFSETPSFGGAYSFEIKVTFAYTGGNTTICTSNCNIVGHVRLTQPITSGNGNTQNIRILGAAMGASRTSQVGFSTSLNPTSITGPQGFWLINNPSNLPGILGTTTSLALSSTSAKFWKEPVTSRYELPTSGNTIGDVRVAKLTNTPYFRTLDKTNNTETWVELFSAPSTKSLSIGKTSVAMFPQDTLPGANGIENVFLGFNAGRWNVADANTFVGVYTGELNTTGSSNVLIGNAAGRKNTSGSNNLFAGYAAGMSSTSGNSNVFLGSQAGLANTTGRRNILIGDNAGANQTTANSIVAVGHYAGHTNNTGTDNVYVGQLAGYYTKTNGNTFLGSLAGWKTNGASNTFVGDHAGYGSQVNVLTGSENTFLGKNTGAANNGNQNTFLGTYSGENSARGSFNTFTGYQTGHQTEGDRNAFYGYLSGVNISAASDNTFMGAKSGLFNHVGLQNTYLGSLSGTSMTGHNNVAVGYLSGMPNDDTAAGGNNNTLIGSFAAAAPETTNATALGYQATTTSSHEIRLGNDSVLKISGAVPWSNTSDLRLKQDIVTSERGLDFVRQLRPVDYTLIQNQKAETGFIAQEVEEVDPSFPGLHKPASHKDFYSLAYTDFIPSIVKSIQQLDDKLKTSTDKSMLSLSDTVTWLKVAVLLLSLCVLACMAVIHRFYGELRSMRLSVQRLA